MSPIDNYLLGVDESQKLQFERIRKIIRRVAPDAEETIAYKIPTFKYKRKNLAHVGFFGDHMSLFPTSRPIEELRDKLKDFKISKGTIQFTMDKPIPDNIIKELLRIRLHDIDKN
jgi:uncharacterized protein YdhG (YjbR/CyaY superfamily)